MPVMDDQPLVACGHCGSLNRRTSEQCFICARPLTGLEVEVADAAIVSRPAPALSPDRAGPPVLHDAGETMALGAGAGADELEAEPGPWDAKRRRTAIVAAAVAGALALGAGVWSARDGGSVSDPFALRAAVTEEPDLAWTWDAGQPIDVVLPMNQGALAVLSDGEIVALDEDGEQRWSRDDSSAGYAVYDARTSVVHVLGSASDEGKVTALDAETGQQRWSVPGEWAVTTGDATLVIAEDEFRRIDTRDGSEIWSVNIDRFGAVSDDGVYGFKDGDLHAWDVDGDEMWVSDLELTESSSGPGASVVALDDFLAMTGWDAEVVGIDPGTGKELWRADPGYAGSLGSIQPGFAFSFPSYEQTSNDLLSEEGSDSPGEIVVYDRDGEVATLPVSGSSYFSAVAIELDGDPHVVDLHSGAIYDEDFKEVGTVPVGQVYPTITGVYDMSDDGISYVPYGAEDPVWTLDPESPESPESMTYLVPGDEFFLVSVGESVSLYR